MFRFLSRFLLLCTTLLIFSPAKAEIGKITELTGPGLIERRNNKLTANINSSIESNDAVVTRNARSLITFQDDSVVRITENSRLVIDDFVYDTNRSSGRLAMNVALGTVKFTSGRIAHNNNQNVRINTPTATVSVRGTDFSMSVDELGRSIIALLPSCPVGVPEGSDKCGVGEIEVSNEAGTTTLNKPYQAVVVDSANKEPSKIFTLDISSDLISNDLLIAPPDDVKEIRQIENEQLITVLDADLLAFKQIDINFLEEDQFEKSLEPIDRLDIDLLGNVLDASNRALEQDLDQLAEKEGVLPGFKEVSGLQASYNEEEVRLYRESANHLVSVRTDRDAGGIVEISQNGIATKTQINSASNVIVNVFQSN